ncbi:DUF3772 domain-containing protein [Primorskyibacter sp. S87]|uniref:DUF3772 domain-containing protein n=1 Tax=Primorskyibacter sp. S87 TaxID=3415126 RepID=UPI003C7D6EF1
MQELRRLLVAVLAAMLIGLLGFVGDVSAQLSDTNRQYYLNWMKTAQRAEEVVDANRASNAALENLRKEIGGYRDIFSGARTENTERIRTLESQIEALGPAPEGDAEEAKDIAALREHLNEQLDKLRVPRIISEEAFTRANGLIHEIDRIIRDRQAKELMTRGPSPLSPKYWGMAWRDIQEASRALVSETTTNLSSATIREQARERLPVIVTLLAIGCVLIARGRRWSERMGDYLRTLGGSGTGVWSFVVSLLRIFMPWIGVLALSAALLMTGFLGVRGTLLLEQVPIWAFTIFAFNWIGRQVFLNRSSEGLKLLPAGQIAELRLLIDMLAVMLVLYDLVLHFEQIENIPETTRSVISFPVVLTTALLLLRVRRLRGADEAGDGVKVSRAGFGKVIEGLRTTLFLMCIVSPVLSSLGYYYAAEALVFPAVESLAVIASMIILHRFVGGLYSWITRTGEAGRDSLFTVLAGFVLAIATLPLFALIWGARPADLTEVWQQLLEGFDIGGVRISPTNFLTFVLIFAIGLGLTRLLQGGLRNSLLPKTNIDPGGQNAIVSGTGYVGIFLAALVAITGAGFDLSSLAIVAGALSVGIGFGLQTIVSNFVSGIILLIERPISKGDWIDVNGQMGYVRDISVRSTRIETFDRTDVIVPNSDLISGSVTNYTRGNTVGRVIVPVGVAYGSDTRRVEEILREVANAHPMVLINPAPSVVFQGFGADSLDFEIRAILRDVNWVLSVKSDMNHEINKRFTEEGIEIPFAQRDVWLRNPEALLDPTSQAGQAETGSPDERDTDEPAMLTEADMDAGDPDEV